MSTEPTTMRVVHITLSAGPGGGPEHVWRLANQMSELGIIQSIAAPDEYPYAERYTELVGRDGLLELPSRAFQLAALLRLIRFLRKRKADLLHSHGKGAGLYGRLASFITGIPCVHTFHGLHLSQRPISRILYVRLERMLRYLTSASIAVSAGEAALARSLGWIQSGQLHIVPNGVQVSHLPPEFASCPGPFIVAHMTRFDRVQKNSGALVGIALALRDAGRLEDFRFLLLGEGEGRTALEQRIAELNLSNYFVFKRFILNPKAELSKAHAYVSTSRWEGLPLAVLEAQAAGLPAVLTDVVGNRDAIENGVTGFTFPLDDYRAAAKALLFLASDPARAARMGFAGWQRVLVNHSVERMARETLAVYQSVLS